MDKETMLRWERSAYDAGDVESWLIARAALGCEGMIDESLNLPMRRQRQIARMTQRGAQRLVARWEKQAPPPRLYCPKCGADTTEDDICYQHGADCDCHGGCDKCCGEEGRS